MAGIEERLAALEERYTELGRELAAPDAYQDHERIQHLSQGQARLRDVVESARRWKEAQRAANEAEEMARDEHDSELVALAEDEIRHQRTAAQSEYDYLQ